MSEELKAKIKKVWEEAYNEGKMDALGEIVASDYITHRAPFPDSVGLENQKNFIADCRASYPDLHLSFDKITIEGDWSTALWTYEGTQTGKSITTGAPPTNKHIKFRGCTMARWEGGKGVEEWVFGDYLGCFEQLGYVQKLW